MVLKRNLSVAAFLLLSAALAAGLFGLFGLRFYSGAMVPRYSTYRSDPVGTKIFFQALKELPERPVERKLTPLKTLQGSDAVVLYLGRNDSVLSGGVPEDLCAYLDSGGRAVLAFRPLAPLRREPKKMEKKSSDSVEEDDADCEAPDVEDEEERVEWGMTQKRFSRKELKKPEAGEEPAKEAVSDAGSRAPIPWRSARYFSELSEEWRVLYRYYGQAVVIEREWGRGSMLLLADSYLVSNEAMVCDRHTELLTYLLGKAANVFFDETHLGITSQESVMGLLNRYRLQGVLAAFILLAALFVWKNARGFIPRHIGSSGNADHLNAGCGSSQGFTNLLRRHVPQKKLMDTILAEWESTLCRQASMKHKAEKLDAELKKAGDEKENLHPVDLYNRLTESLKERS